MNEFEKILTGIKPNPIFEHRLIIPAFEEFFNHLDRVTGEEMPLIAMIDLFSNGTIKDIVRRSPNQEVLKEYTPNLLALIESMK